MTRSDAPDLVTLGETMAAFVHDGAPDSYRLLTAGAESNLAAGMAQVGCRTQWWSRLGEDNLGAFLRESISAHGVDVVAALDPDRRTGVCVKEIGPTGTRMRYYRAGSAASRLDLVDLEPLRSAPRLHLTGVTPALSAENRAVVTDLLATRVGGTSFDVNYRPALWDDADHAASVLVPLARQADLVLIGDDESHALLGTVDVDAVAAALLSGPGQELVFKRGAGAATVITPDTVVSEAAHAVAVVDVTGAGDAFAAGYLAASVWGWEPRGRLRLGHFLAARVVGVVADIGPAVGDSELLDLATNLRQTMPRMTGNRRR